MAKAFIEWEDGTTSTLEEFEQFQNEQKAYLDGDDTFVHGSGCVIRKSIYETDFGNGARL